LEFRMSNVECRMQPQRNAAASLPLRFSVSLTASPSSARRDSDPARGPGSPLRRRNLS
jgi:hypothetical protein